MTISNWAFSTQVTQELRWYSGCPLDRHLPRQEQTSYTSRLPVLNHRAKLYNMDAQLNKPVDIYHSKNNQVTKIVDIFTLPQNSQKYLECWETSIFLICLRKLAPYLVPTQHWQDTWSPRLACIHETWKLWSGQIQWIYHICQQFQPSWCASSAHTSETQEIKKNHLQVYNIKVSYYVQMQHRKHGHDQWTGKICALAELNLNRPFQ